MPDVIMGYSEYDGVLYVKTRDNPWAAVPLGKVVSRNADGFAVIASE